MDEKFTQNNIENDKLTLDYQKLITRLKEINLTIVLLNKKYLDKF